MGNEPVIDFHKTSPGEQDNLSVGCGSQENLSDRRIGLSDVSRQVEDLAYGTSFGINDFSPQEFT